MNWPECQGQTPALICTLPCLWKYIAWYFQKYLSPPNPWCLQTFSSHCLLNLDFSGSTKNLSANAGDIEMWVRSLGWEDLWIRKIPGSGRSLGREDPWRRKWQPTLVFLPGESHGRRSLVGTSPWHCKELDTIEQLHFHFHALQEEMATYSSVLA